MSEYIITDKQLKTATEAYTERELSLPITEVFVSGKRLPEIVRCRDCKFADWDITAWWCIRNKYYPFEIGELRGYGERSHLDGFCAWGERKC